MKKLISLTYFGFIQICMLQAQSWSLTGNSGTTPGTNFLGTVDSKALLFKVNNQQAGYLGYDAKQGKTAFGTRHY